MKWVMVATQPLSSYLTLYGLFNGTACLDGISLHGAESSIHWERGSYVKVTYCQSRDDTRHSRKCIEVISRIDPNYRGA